MPSFDTHRIRSQFPILHQQAHGQPLIYLDNAATTQKPLSVIQAMDSYYRESHANVHRAAHTLSARATHHFEQAREAVQHFLNARHSEEIIWTRGATEALNLVANSWGRSQLKPGDEVLISLLEHHANIVPWQLVTQVTGARLKWIGLDEQGCLDYDDFKRQLSSKTRLVAMTQTSNALGIITPIQQIIRDAQGAGALTLVDGSQAVAHQSVDVQALGCDFYVFSGHKVYGPTGIGVLYGRQSLLETMPPWQAGGEMIERVSVSGTTFNTLPFKFEAGTPHIAGAIGLDKALKYIRQFSPNQLHQHEAQLLSLAEAGLDNIKGIKRIGISDHKAPVVSFISEQLHNQDIGLMLDQQGIAVRTGHHCAMPLMDSLGLTGTIRASFALYNTEEEVHRFIQALEHCHATELHPVLMPPAATNEMPNIFTELPFDQTSLSLRFERLKSWQDKYRQIMLLGKELPAMSQEQKSEDARLHGCESTVWLHHFYDEETMKLYFAADSDARIIRGLIALVLAYFSGKTAREIEQVDIESEFKALDLFNHLSPSRGNGLKAIIQEIRNVAHRYQ